MLAAIAPRLFFTDGSGCRWKFRFTRLRNRSTALALAEIALGRGTLEEALQHAEEVIARSRTLGRVRYEVAGLQVRGQALAVQGHTGEALGHLQNAVARGAKDPAMFLRAAAALFALDGDDALLAEARAAVERIAAQPNAELRRRFLAAEPVRLVMRLAR